MLLLLVTPPALSPLAHPPLEDAPNCVAVPPALATCGAHLHGRVLSAVSVLAADAALAKYELAGVGRVSTRKKIDQQRAGGGRAFRRTSQVILGAAGRAAGGFRRAPQAPLVTSTVGWQASTRAPQSPWLADNGAAPADG